MGAKQTCGPQTWAKLPDAPFGDKYCGRSAVLSNDEIILSPRNDNHIYKFNIKSQSWNKYSFGDYKNIECHAICASNDNKTLFLFDGSENKILLMIDIETMKVIKKIDNMIWTGSYPVIITDPYNNKLVHIIGGNYNKKHICVNIENGKTNIMYEFNTDKSLDGGVIININIQNKDIWLFIQGEIPIHSFDLKTKQWTNLKVKIPNIYNFGCIQTSNDKYVVLFGGLKCDTGDVSDDIIIYDIEARKYKISNVKTPTYGYINTVITKNGDIHLFEHYYHYKISINNILDWECIECNYLNKNESIICIKCESNKEKKSNEIKEDEKEEKNKNEWICDVCTFVNDCNIERCLMCKKGEQKREKKKSEVNIWLCDIVKLREYCELFEENGCDEMDDIENIKDADLISIGISKVFHRKRIMKEINKLKEKEVRNEEKKEEKGINLVQEWLTNTVGLPQYFNNFIADGYDDMLTITDGINEHDLMEIGINKKGHRKKILIFIQKYKNKQNKDENNNNHNRNVIQAYSQHLNYIAAQIEGINIQDTAK